VIKKLVLLTICVFVLVGAGAAFAITYGQPDGNRHPFVGSMVRLRPEGGVSARCSGTLISPTVFLTAAHCAFDDPNTPVYVSFDTRLYINQPPTTLYKGTFYGDPRYNQRQNNPYDIAVIVLDEPVQGIAPAQLPTLGLLDDARVNTGFTAVGYGRQEPVTGAGGIVNAYTGEREFSTSSLNAVNKNWLRLSQNPATGDGGACYGDSGGPNFIGTGSGETTIIAATTITGDAICRATNVAYRLDTEAARSFLGQFVELP
jgi:secreted trypsin-like serine protease